MRLTWWKHDELFDLLSTSSGCVADLVGDVTCRETLKLPAGSYDIRIALYAGTGGSGAMLSRASTSVTVVAGSVTKLPVVTDGIPTTATVTLGAPPAQSQQVPQGIPTSMPVIVSAFDAAGNLIVKPGPYAKAVALTDSDTTGGTHLSATAIPQPGTSVTLKYNGGVSFTAATITPTIAGRPYPKGAASLTASATITEYQVPTTYYGGWPVDIAAGPDGAIWFTQRAVNQVGRITTHGVMSQVAAPPGNAIASGPDGALWYTDASNLNTVQRLTTSGSVTAYTGPNANSYFGTITSGPDGALWATDSPGNTVTRIATDGTMTPYPLPSPSSQPAYITTASDGALWFGEYSGHVGRITTSGSVTGMFPTGEVQSITNGPDGAVWFTALDGTVKRITGDGTITTYAASGPAFAITNGPDGALWFTEDKGANNENIGRITTAGNVTEYVIPNPTNYATSITKGPDNALWFIDCNGAYVGRVPVAIVNSARAGRNGAVHGHLTHPFDLTAIKELERRAHARLHGRR